MTGKKNVNAKFNTVISEDCLFSSLLSRTRCARNDVLEYRLKTKSFFLNDLSHLLNREVGRYYRQYNPSGSRKKINIDETVRPFL